MLLQRRLAFHTMLHAQVLLIMRIYISCVRAFECVYTHARTVREPICCMCPFIRVSESVSTRRCACVRVRDYVFMYAYVHICTHE